MVGAISDNSKRVSIMAMELNIITNAYNIKDFGRKMNVMVLE